MGIKTEISYCDSTCNPVIGCTGCELWYPNRLEDEQHCYAATLVRRWAGRKGYPEAFDKPQFFPGRIEQALRWSDFTGTNRPGKPWLDGFPRIIFLNDMSDTFIKEPSPYEWLAPLIPKMEESPHIWLFLTKRSLPMLEFFTEYGHVPDNFWPGVTVTSTSTRRRLIDLLEIRARVHWVSLEPLLELVDIEDWLTSRTWRHQLRWVVVGGESGSNARPFQMDWGYKIVRQCQGADVPVFVKQMGDNAYYGGDRVDWLGKKGGDMNKWPADLQVRQMPMSKDTIFPGFGVVV